ncbi:MAG: arylsulfatase [Chloroflexota bacterium]
MTATKPNIIYILADDMGYGDVSCLNENSKIQTVHLDQLAAGGCKFRDAHSTSAVCTPSRYSIITGRYNWRSTLKQGVKWGYSKPLIEKGRLTSAAFLKQHGYHTACLGKWHLGWQWGLKTEAAEVDAGNEDTPNFEGEDIDFTQPISDGPVSVGFDYFFGISASLDMAPYVYVENDRVTAQPDRIVPESGGKEMWRAGPIAPDFEHREVLPLLTNKAVDYVDRHANDDAPFYLYFPLPAPHTPILPTDEFIGKSGTNSYGDFCLQVDDLVGQLMAALERNNIVDNTIFIFTSDNGCSNRVDFEELASFDHQPSYIFRGHKADIYEGGHRIPLIVRWPTTIEAGTASDETVCLVDFLATCADILDDTLPEDAAEDSVSNLPLWRGETLDSTLREATVHSSMDGSLSIRKGRWKLEMCPGSGGWSYPKPGPECEGLPPLQLYDLDADIGERNNITSEQPAIVEELTELLTRYIRNGRSTPGTAQQNTGEVIWPQLWLLSEGQGNYDYLALLGY